MCDCPNIKDIGNLRNLRVLRIDGYVDGVHLLKNLDMLQININCSIKMKRRLKKLKKINPNVCFKYFNY